MPDSIAKIVAEMREYPLGGDDRAAVDVFADRLEAMGWRPMSEPPANPDTYFNVVDNLWIWVDRDTALGVLRGRCYFCEDGTHAFQAEGFNGDWSKDFKGWMYAPRPPEG